LTIVSAAATPPATIQQPTEQGGGGCGYLRLEFERRHAYACNVTVGNGMEKEGLPFATREGKRGAAACLKGGAIWAAHRPRSVSRGGWDPRVSAS
jgi:hypothetical protein